MLISLLALTLANKFVEDSVVGMPSTISSPLMYLMGFSLVLIWWKIKSKTKLGS
ncbi:putative Bile acid:sodium symporter [Medicago truncatula]|uniref:Putative Bile acid:sodium symporter n=1 Tax=Medicago truncatula TaxID=3880 RepID=A0A396JF16_MEDTR|nr:putative Bile acid:sodium symporter [Medicago truncatula]